MLQPLAPVQQTATLSDLAWRLTRLGYAEYVKSFNPLSIGSTRWLTAPVAIPGRIVNLAALFLFGMPVERRLVDEDIGDFIAGLVDLGILIETDGVVVTSGIILVPIANIWLFVSRPRANALLYVGDDSIGMLWRQSVRPGGRCLDLCSGPGLQALGASTVAGHVDAVEINPVAMALAQLNVTMNRRDDRITVHLGSLYQPVLGTTYDNIIANPPFLPVPDSLNYPFVGSGGPDGLRVVSQILDGLPRALAPDGIAQIICALPSDGARPSKDSIARLQSWCSVTGFDLLISTPAHIPMHRGSFFFEGLVQTALAASGGDVDAMRDAMEAAYQGSGNSHVASCFLHATRGSGRLQVANLDHRHGSLWFI